MFSPSDKNQIESQIPSLWSDIEFIITYMIMISTIKTDTSVYPCVQRMSTSISYEFHRTLSGILTMLDSFSLKDI
jgi:hypothetical protein